MATDFYDDSYEEYDDYECGSYEDNGYEWTEEDSWDALTECMVKCQEPLGSLMR